MCSELDQLYISATVSTQSLNRSRVRGDKPRSCQKKNKSCCILYTFALPVIQSKDNIVLIDAGNICSVNVKHRSTGAHIDYQWLASHCLIQVYGACIVYTRWEATVTGVWQTSSVMLNTWVCYWFIWDPFVQNLCKKL